MFELDARSAVLWCCIEDGLDEAETVRAFAEDLGLPMADAREVVEDVTRHLAALIETDVPAHASGQGIGPAQRVCLDRDPCARPQPGPYRMRLSMLGTVFDVHFPEHAMLQRFRPLVEHLATDSPDGEVEVVVVRQGDGYGVRVGGEHCADCASFDEVASQTKAAICHAAANGRPFGACLHAAVVKEGGGAVLIAGESGSGKSCLAIALAAAGYPCLSDDLALLDLEWATVEGVPAASCIKSEAWTAMSRVLPALHDAPVHRRVDGKAVKYVPVAMPEAPLPVTMLVLPRFGPGQDARAVALGADDALRRLLKCVLAWRLELTPEAVDRLVAWIEGIPCFELHYPSGEEACRLFGTLVGDRSSRGGS